MLRKSIVKEIFNRYHKAIKTNPNRYRLANGGVNLTLPEELCWTWSNRCAGDSGGSNPRPVGIRLEPNKVKEMYGTQDFAMKSIFASVDSLYNFIKSSDCGGAEHLLNKLINKRISTSTKEPMFANQQMLIEVALLRLSIEKKDAELAKMVISGKVKDYSKVLDNSNL
jgi:hypothetical protein